MNHSRTGESTTGSWNRNKLAKLAGLGGGALLLGGLTVHMVNTLPESQYENNFTDGGKCLDGTPYDADNGARIENITIDGSEAVQVVPKGANNLEPSVLYITETDKGWYGFGDNQTGAFLVQMECENIPTGY